MAYCVECGRQAAEGDRFCELCGTALISMSTAPGQGNATPVGALGTPVPQGLEVLLFSFGPFGVSVCDGPYSMFKWQRKNTTVIEVTNLGILGKPNRRPGFARLRPVRKNAPFEIPYGSIVAAQVYPHPARLGLMEMLDITYREGGSIYEKSICSYRDSIQRTFAILESHLPPS
jgi:zinc-ribbon domain